MTSMSYVSTFHTPGRSPINTRSNFQGLKSRLSGLSTWPCGSSEAQREEAGLMRGLGLLAGLPVLSHLLQKGRVALSARPDGCARYPPAA